MIDLAKRLSGIFHWSRAGHFEVQLHSECPVGAGRLNSPTIKAVSSSYWGHSGFPFVVHDRSGCWFQVRQTATGSMARCTLTSS